MPASADVLCSAVKRKYVLGVQFRYNYRLYLPAAPSSVTVIKDATGRYFASFVVQAVPEALPETESLLGIDLGLTHFAVLSDGRKIASPRFLRRAEKKLRRAQRALSHSRPTRRADCCPVASATSPWLARADPPGPWTAASTFSRPERPLLVPSSPGAPGSGGWGRHPPLPRVRAPSSAHAGWRRPEVV
jgi:hypothetical protein